MVLKDSRTLNLVPSKENMHYRPDIRMCFLIIHFCSIFKDSEYVTNVSMLEKLISTRACETSLISCLLYIISYIGYMIKLYKSYFGCNMNMASKPCHILYFVQTCIQRQQQPDEMLVLTLSRCTTACKAIPQHHTKLFLYWTASSQTKHTKHTNHTS